MPKVKTNIRIDENTKKIAEYLANEKDVNFSRYLEIALNEKIENDVLKRRGGKIIKVENPQLVPSIIKNDDKESSKIVALDKLCKLFSELDEIDPMCTGKVLNDLIIFLMQRLTNDDNDTIYKFMKTKVVDDEKINEIKYK